MGKKRKNSRKGMKYTPVKFNEKTMLILFWQCMDITDMRVKRA